MKKLLLLLPLLTFVSFSQTTVSMPNLTVTAEATAAIQKWMLGQVKSQAALAQPVASGDLTITLVSAAGIKNNDMLVIETEAMSVTGAPAGNVVTVNRAQLGTTAAAHPVTAPVSNLTYQSFRNLFKSIIAQTVGQIMDSIGSDTINTQNQVITTAQAAKQAAKDAAVQ